MVAPQQRLPLEDAHLPIPDFFIEVVKLSTAPLTFRTVLIVEIKNTQYWQSGIQRLQEQINQQCDSAFSSTAHTKMYWIGTIGPHWRYGEQMDDGQGPIPLINWHDTTHDQASFNDFRVLADLIHDMCVFIFLLRDPIMMLIHDAGDLVCLTLESKLATSRKWHTLLPCPVWTRRPYYPIHHCTELYRACMVNLYEYLVSFLFFSFSAATVRVNLKPSVCKLFTYEFMHSCVPNPLPNVGQLFLHSLRAI